MAKFAKGDVIVQDKAPELFSIWGGNAYADNEGIAYTLTAYCDVSEGVLDIDVTNNVDCGYILLKKNLQYWRKATDTETLKISVFLAKKGYIYDKTTRQVRKMRKNESFVVKSGNKEIKIQNEHKKEVSLKNNIKDKRITHSTQRLLNVLKTHCEEYVIRRMKEAMITFVDKQPKECKKKS